MIPKIKAYGICLYKNTPHDTSILLCKSVNSKDKWGFLKGVQLENETKEETATREFFEESSIDIDKKYFEKYYFQINKTKDIGIYLVNYNSIKDIETYFENDKLHNHCLSWENSKAQFFSITSLPKIKKKQDKLIKEMINYFNQPKRN